MGDVAVGEVAVDDGLRQGCGHDQCGEVGAVGAGEGEAVAGVGVAAEAQACVLAAVAVADVEVVEVLDYIEVIHIGVIGNAIGGFLFALG